MEKSIDEHIGFLIDQGFNSAGAFSFFSKKLFDIDKESRIILGVIAKHGPVVENKITNLGFKKSHQITREKVRYRLLKSDLSSGYVIKKRGKRHRNIKNAFGKNQEIIEKPYHLTFKGMVASLAETKFEENYMIKNYKKLFKHVDLKIYANLVIQLMKYALGVYMAYAIINGRKFSDLQHLAFDYERNFELNILRFANVDNVAINDEKIEKITYEIRMRYFLINTMLSNIDRPFIKKDNKFIHSTWILIDRWHQIIEKIQFEKFTPFDPKTFYQNEAPETIPIQISLVNDKVKKLLKDLHLKDSKSYQALYWS